VFQIYTVMLMVSGVLLVVVGSSVPGYSVGLRILNAVIGIAFFGYGFYLEFLFQGGSYRIFFYVFVVPVLLLIRAVRGWSARRAAKAAAQPSYAPAGFAAAPPTYPMPQNGYPSAGALPQPNYGQPNYGQANYGPSYGQPGYGQGVYGQPLAAPDYPAYRPAPPSAPPVPPNGTNNHTPPHHPNG
jgi:hypothetical protein